MMNAPLGYIVATLTRRRSEGGPKSHIGIVMYYYGPYQYARVRTLCGRTGRMVGKAKPEPGMEPSCGTCQRVWETKEEKDE